LTNSDIIMLTMTF